MKLSVIGPVAPFKSGIARHTTALVRTARQLSGCDVRVHSFQRQYPSRLYPGQSQVSVESHSSEPREAFHIDTVNPLSWSKSADQIIADKPDAAIFTAWTFFVAPALGYIARRVQQSGVKVVLMVHNATDHDAKWWQRITMRYQMAAADAYIAHTESVAQCIRTAGITAPVKVMAHPLYDDFPTANPGPFSRRGLELLFFGYIRPYKGLDVLLHAVAQCNRRDFRLTVAGEPWSNPREIERLVAKLGIEDRVTLHLEHVSDQQAADLFSKCDAVVMPYHRATGSGVAAMAQFHEKPIIATRVSGLIEAAGAGKTGWLFEPGNVAQLSELLDQHVTRGAALAMLPQLSTQKHSLQWEAFVEELRGLIECIQCAPLAARLVP